jgi:hypothetical protein
MTKQPDESEADSTPTLGYVNGVNVHFTLESAKILLGPKIYEQALTDASLQRYLTTSPNWADLKAAKSTELNTFWLSVYQHTAKSTFKLLQRNVGSKIAELALAQPKAHERKDHIMLLPKTERLEQTIKGISEVVNADNLGLTTAYEPYKQGFLFYFKHCPFFCRHIQPPTSEPFCQMYEHLFFKMFKWYTELPLISQEIECIAMGQPQCRYYYGEWQP